MMHFVLITKHWQEPQVLYTPCAQQLSFRHRRQHLHHRVAPITVQDRIGGLSGA